MSLLPRLLEQLDRRGLSIAPGKVPGELRLVGDRKEMTPEILEAVKAFKPQLLERFGNPVPYPKTEADMAPESREAWEGVKAAVQAKLAARVEPQPAPIALEKVFEVPGYELPDTDPPPTVCDLCGKLWYCPPGEIPASANSPLFCDRGGAPAVKNRAGVVVTPAVPRCPFKEGQGRG